MSLLQLQGMDQAILLPAVKDAMRWRAKIVVIWVLNINQEDPGFWEFPGFWKGENL